MPTQQQDYIVRHLQTISRLVARLRLKGGRLSPGDRLDLDDGLREALRLQEQNFGRPAAEFLALSADEQFETLRRAETTSAGHQRCLAYVALLRSTADLYAFRDRSDLAVGARLLALHVALRVALDGPAGATGAQRQVTEILHLLDGAEPAPPTRELLAAHLARTGG